MTELKSMFDPDLKVGDTVKMEYPERYNHGWINIGIEYPPENEYVLLSDGYKIGFGYLVIQEKLNIRHWKSHQDLGWITHWMKLPELPK